MSGPIAPLTPDGAPVVPLARRGGAMLLDVLFVVIPVYVVTSLGFYALRLAGVLDVADRTSDLVRDALVWVVWMAYQYLFLTRSGMTPGKRLLDLRVRPWERPGPVSGGAAGRRALVTSALLAGGVLPGVGQLLSLLVVVDVVSGFVSKEHRPLHDVWAGTAVTTRAGAGDAAYQATYRPTYRPPT